MTGYEADIQQLVDQLRDALELPTASAIVYDDARQQFVIIATYWWAEGTPTDPTMMRERHATADMFITRELAEREPALARRFWDQRRRKLGIPIKERP